jgi:hypothetical protein
MPNISHGANSITGHSGLNPACASIVVSPVYSAPLAQQGTSSSERMLHLCRGNDRRPDGGRSPYTLEVDQAQPREPVTLDVTDHSDAGRR